MASNKPPRDDQDKKPATDAHEAPDVDTDAEDAEIVADTTGDSDGETVKKADPDTSPTDDSAQADGGVDTVHASDSADVELVDGEPEDTRHDSEAAAATADSESEEQGRGIAAPFAIILAALAVVFVLVYFLDRDDGDETPGTDGELFAEADEPEATQPMTRDPVGRNRGAENAEETAETTDTDETGDTEVAATETDGDEQAVAAADETETPGAETDSTRSALLARAAERNRARREAREEAAAAEADQSDDAGTAVAGNAETAAPAMSLAEITRRARPDAEETSTADTSTTGAESAEADRDDDEATDDRPTTVAARTDDTEESASATETPQARERMAATSAQPRSTTPVAETPAAPAADVEEIKADVLAETEVVIDRKLQRTEREVQALRSEVTEQRRVANERLAALTRKVENIESGDLTETRSSTLLLALADLDEGIRSGEPFSRELDTVSRIAPNNRTLTQLREYAPIGLPTDNELMASYQMSARQALSGAKREEAQGVFGRFAANMSGLFTVRRTGEVPGDTPSAIIARAETRLQANDLVEAVRELKDLEGEARDAFDDWISGAEARIEAERRIDALERSITSRAG